eukprot:m.111682 g.111682  ORF g.111682 m.111682 type:complete len:133 (+) comp12945_c0_seq1:3938-4336(+)
MRSFGNSGTFFKRTASAATPDPIDCVCQESAHRGRVGTAQLIAPVSTAHVNQPLLRQSDPVQVQVAGAPSAGRRHHLAIRCSHLDTRTTARLTHPCGACPVTFRKQTGLARTTHDKVPITLLAGLELTPQVL